MRGAGADQAMFVKAALPLGRGFSAGVLLSYELSQFDAVPTVGSGYVHLETQWRPSGGFGVTWQPDPRFLLGARALFNNDWESRTDPSATSGGLYQTFEGRLGASAALWPGGLLDVGGTARQRNRGLDHTSAFALGPGPTSASSRPSSTNGSPFEPATTSRPRRLA
jgi:hypothetical protein